MAERTTIKDIAAAAGCSGATVSMALRHHPRIPHGTRARIESLAARMGYRPDPMLSSLIAYRLNRRPHPLRSVLAFVDNSALRSNTWQTSPILFDLHQSAIQALAGMSR